MQAVIDREYCSWGNAHSEVVRSPWGVRSVVIPVVIGTLSLCYRKDLADTKADAVYEKLSRIEQLTENWNGYGAVPISKEVIANTRRLLGFLAVKPEVFPVPDGSIQIEYDRKDGAYLEIHVENENNYSSYRVDSDGTESSEDSLSFAEVVDRINGFIKSEI